MSCLMLFLIAMEVLYFGALATFFLAVGNVSLFLIALVLIPLVVLLTWRIIYPWLVRMGRWSAQLRNIIFLALILVAASIGLAYIIPLPTVTLPILEIDVSILVLIFGLLFLFLLLLGLVVWVVRLWRRGWPLVRDFFWDISFRIVALFWKILVGIPLGVTWFLYHPPLRWLVAVLLFYLRGISAGAAWLLYNPPLKSIGIAIFLITKLIGLIVAAILYNPPILWLVQAGLFILRLAARVISTAIYGIWSWWPLKGVRGTLKTGITAESKSYQDYKYA
jgi:hypothetical protein